ncbi:UNVERIFIED_CONTAM: DNA/RNA-binding domain of Phe-tRNA-synthetase-like protein [Streptomyces graminofaciens]
MPSTAPSAPTPAASAPASTPWAAAWRRRAPCPGSTRPSTPTNAVSVRHGLPAGAFDLDHVTGDVEIRYADGSESFTPLGEPGTVENPKPGEVIYTDTTDVLTRHWNHRDAHRTRVTEDSTRVAFVLETVAATRDEQLLETAADDLQALLQPHCNSSSVHYLSPAHPDATA